MGNTYSAKYDVPPCISQLSRQKIGMKVECDIIILLLSEKDIKCSKTQQKLIDELCSKKGFIVISITQNIPDDVLINKQTLRKMYKFCCDTLKKYSERFIDIFVKSIYIVTSGDRYTNVLNAFDTQPRKSEQLKSLQKVKSELRTATIQYDDPSIDWSFNDFSQAIRSVTIINPTGTRPRYNLRVKLEIDVIFSSDISNKQISNYSKLFSRNCIGPLRIDKLKNVTSSDVFSKKLLIITEYINTLIKVTKHNHNKNK